LKVCRQEMRFHREEFHNRTPELRFRGRELQLHGREFRFLGAELRFHGQESRFPTHLWAGYCPVTRFRCLVLNNLGWQRRKAVL